MRFTPKTEEQLKQEMGMLAEGEADFEILDAIDAVSKKGSPMLKLNLQIWDKTGRQGRLFDYIVESFHWKLIHLLKAIGKHELYESGLVNPIDIIGCSGKLEIAIKKSEQYGDKPTVKDYISRDEILSDAAEPPALDADFDFNI